MKRVIAFVGFIIYCFTVQGQQLVSEKLFRVNSKSKGMASSALTKNGNPILTGNYAGNPGIETLFMLLKPNIDTLWIKKGPVLSSGGGGIKETLSGDFAYYGTMRYNTSPATSGTALQKYDGNGLLKWTSPYAVNTFDTGHLLLLSQDNGYFVGGRNIIAGNYNGFTLGRTDSLGNLKWRKGYDLSNNDFLADMQHTKTGNIIMYGIAGAPQHLRVTLVKQNGDTVMSRKLIIVGANRSERLWSNQCSITPLSDGGFLMAAEIDTSVANASPYMGMAVKVNANLQPVWHYVNRSLPNNVTFTRSRELTDGSVVMLAHERKGALSTSGNKFFLYRFSSTGNLLNVYTFTTTLAAHIITQTLEALPDSSFVIGGFGVVTPAPNFSSGFYVAKVKIAGLAPALPLPGPVKITGTKEETLFAGTALGQSYPNPTTTETIIPFSLPKNYSKASIMIREVATGRKIRKYDLKPNTSSLTIDVSGLNSGLYLYSLVVDDKPVATKKLAVMK